MGRAAMPTAGPGKGALSGRRVVVTRASDQAGGFTAMLRAAGAEVVELPTIRTVPPPSWDAVDEAIAGIPACDFAIFTSVNALRFFFGRLAELGLDGRALAGLKVVAVGPKTAAEMAARGVEPDILPREFKAEGVLRALEPYDLRGSRILFPRAETAREVLPDELRRRGAEVVLAVVYRTVAPDADPARVKALFAGGVSAVTFTSSSTVKNFMKMAGPGAAGLLDGVCIACIGPVTALTCKEMGLAVSVVPDEYTVDALFGALTGYFTRRK